MLQAITEHNILACTHLFESISLDSLAQKLLINADDVNIIFLFIYFLNDF